MSALAAWLEERFKLSALLEFASHKKVPLHRASVFYYAGGVCAFLFGLQVATGILLLMYYRVGVDASYESVRYITTHVAFGWLMRSVHSWGANLMVLAAFVHLYSVLFMGAYRKPRELTWLTGIALLALSMAFGFSGYLLPWNELAYFATKVGTDIVGQVPVVGHWLLRLVRGGDEVTGATLSRFFGLHVAVLPALTAGLIGVHLLFVQVQGMAGAEKAKRTMPFFPGFLVRDAILWLLVLNAVCALAVFFPWELGKKADPLSSAPAGIKPEWYFLSQYQFLKVLPGTIGPVPGELVGIVLIGAAGGLFALVPFWERLLPEPSRDRAVAVFGWVSLAVLAAMTVWGHYS